MTDIGAKNLLCAVVECAVKDYRDALINNRNISKSECERFFKSKAFDFWNITNLSGVEIINEIKSQI